MESSYDCLSFAKDYNALIGGGTPVSFIAKKHYGILLGRTQYGESVILSSWVPPILLK